MISLGMAMSSTQETDKSTPLPEHQKGWKSRLHRFQSSIRRSIRPRKANSPGSSLRDGKNRVDRVKDNENELVNGSLARDSGHVRREILSREKHNTVSTSRDNAAKTSSHNNHMNGKTSFDRWSLDRRKFERSKTISNNNFKEIENFVEPSSNHTHVTELAGTSNQKKRSQKVKLPRANVNTERTSISRSKSLSILTNLFKRSNLSRDKNNRGKSLSNATTSQTAVSNSLSTATSSDFDTLLTGDHVLSCSSIDSFPDSDRRIKKSDKYYSLKRSRGALIFPKNNLARSFSLDTSLDPDILNPAMEKSRTVAAIPPCILVEEFRDNCGFFERSLTAEFVHGSSGSVTIDAGSEYYERLTACSTPVISTLQSELDLSSSVGREHDAIEISSETTPNITEEAEKSNGLPRKQSAPPSLSFSTEQSSSNDENIGAGTCLEGEGDIVAEEESDQFAVHRPRECTCSQSSRQSGSSFATSEPKDFVDFKSDMGSNNSTYVQRARTFVPREAKIRPRKKRASVGRYSKENCLDGEADPIILESNFLECFEREIRHDEFNDRFVQKRDACSSNGLTKVESSALYATNDPSKMMINSNYPEDCSDVKRKNGESTETYFEGELKADEKWTGDRAKHLPNGKVNSLHEACDNSFCSSTFGQTEPNDSLVERDCLHCTKTRQGLTDSELKECSSVRSDPSASSKTTKRCSLSDQLLRDHITEKLITCGLHEIHNGDQGLVGAQSRSPKVNSLPSSPFASSTPAQVMHSSYPDITRMHKSHLSRELCDSTDSFSSNGQQVANSLEDDSSIFDSSEQKTLPPLSFEKCKCKNRGELMGSHLSPGTPEERLRSCSTGIPSRSPLHQILLTENRSASCTQLDQKDEENVICSSPPYVRPRIQSLEELPPCTAEVVLRKKRSIIKKTRVKHAASLPVVDSVFINEMLNNGKRHSYGGYGDALFLQLPHLLQRSMSAEGQLDSCNSSMQSINSSSSFTESELGSTVSVTSDFSSTGAFDKILGRSRSVPGYLGIADIPQTSPIPEEQSSVPETDLLSNSSGNSDDGDFDEMDVPEAFAEALWDHVTMDPEELSFQAGDIITVLAMTSCEWWFGQVKDRVGWFPAPFVRVRVSQTLAADETRLAPPVRTRKGTNEGFLSDAVVRSRVVQEILNTERGYVNNLKDVVEGYLKQARRRTDMFTEDQIVTIFSNVEQIYNFHQEILKQLEECFVQEDPCATEIGAVFLNNKRGFEIYSEYCNNHPHAMAELKTLCESNKYKQFFEACRLLQEMISISLDGFLLTPVQKICKYPLQLAELKKHTKANHKDFQAVKQALETMKEVASLINERKRKVESIHKIAKWQSTIEGWEGEDVLERSSELIHSGDVIKISNGNSQDRVMFLFDHQLVYCKKDILKKNGLTYKGRIDMDDCTVLNREENHDKSPLHNTWKIFCRKKERWYSFHTKKADDKEVWLTAFEQERQRVTEDATTGLVIPQKTRKAAMMAAQTSVKHKKVNGKKDRLQKSPTTAEIKPPLSPTLRLPEPVSSADFKEEDEDEKDALGLRTSVIRRSFGLRGSKKSKEKRMSSIF